MGAVVTRKTDGSVKPPHWRLKVTFWLDVTLLVSLCALQTVSFTRLVIHEWLRLAIIAMK